MRVCIAEKPSVARDLARVLGANTKRNGYLEGNGYQITWTFGHFCTLKQPEQYHPQWKYWQMQTLPIVPHRFGIDLIPNDGVKRQFDVISSLVNSEHCQEVINCGDAGQEGELIQRWVLLMAKNKKPVKRLWISSLTDDAIKEGFAALREESEFDGLYQAGSARAMGDWLLGINATRLFTIKYSPGRGNVLSLGRVQTPTLAMLVERQHAIDAFVPEKYWELRTKYRDVWFAGQKLKFKTLEEAQEKLALLKEEHFTITDFSRKKGKETPPKLFDLTSLQVESNKKFGLSADDTLKIVQRLYERKLVTYPRVDTQYLPEDMYPKIPAIMRGLPAYAEFTGPLLSKKIIKPKRIFDNKKITDHHAIVPTGVQSGQLYPQEFQVYDLIARRFIAAFSPDAIVSNTVVHGESAGVKFKATGKVILEENWRKVMQVKQKNTGDNDQVLPQFEKGESGPHAPESVEKDTKPPKYYTEATLLRAMETAGKQVQDEEMRDLMKENGIGRPSTRAAIIETLFKRNYISRVRKHLEATPTGMQLIGLIQNELLKSAELTGQMEGKLRLIEKGEYQVEQFKQEMIAMVRNLTGEVFNAAPAVINAATAVQAPAKPSKKSPDQKEVKEQGLKCPKCGQGKVVKGKSAYGCTAFKQGCDFRVPLEMLAKKFTQRQIDALVEKGKTPLIKGVRLEGEKKQGYFVLTDDFNIEFIEKLADGTCPKCKKGKLLKGNSAFGCSRYNEGCNFVLPFEKAGTDDLKQLKLTKKLLDEIL